MSLKLNNVCRTCLSQNTPNQPLFTQCESQDNIPLFNMLNECFSFVVKENDGFPSNICASCVEELHRAFTFKKLCEKTFSSLEKWLEEENNKVQIEDDPGQTDERDSADNEEICEEIALSNFKNDDGTSRESELDQEYTCTDCGQEFLGLGPYWQHMTKVHKKFFSCVTCNLKFRTSEKLLQHNCDKILEQQIEPPKGRTNKSDVKKPRNRSLTCDICNKTFRFHCNVKRHKLIHTGHKPFLCNVCGSSFAQHSGLKIHSYTHTGEKPFKCNMCDRSFGARYTLLTHIRTHTGERPHVCKICGKSFPQSSSMVAHIRTHTGEKPVECKVCHKNFNQKGGLVTHMRVHSGEKPYTCMDCGRSFALRGTLKKHILTHTGERPYNCSVCGKTFAQQGTLSTHMRTHVTKK